MLKQTKEKQGFINPERIEIRRQRTTSSSPDQSRARQKNNNVPPLSKFYSDSNPDHEDERCNIKTMIAVLFHEPILRQKSRIPHKLPLVPMVKSLISQVGPTLATALNGKIFSASL